MLKAMTSHWSPRAASAVRNLACRQLRWSLMAPQRQFHVKSSPRVLHHQTRTVSHATSSITASSLSQRIPPVLLKAEGVCIAAAACLQLASLYVLHSQVLAKYPTAPSATESQPPANTNIETAEHLDATTSPVGVSLSKPTTTATTEAVLQASSSTNTRPEDATTSQRALLSGVAPDAPAVQFTDALVSTSWLGALQGLLLCIALFCNAFLRGRLPAGSASSGLSAGVGSNTAASTAAAAQLVKLEVAVNAHNAQLTQLSHQVEKLNLRTRLSSSELKQPLQVLQQQVAQHAGVMSELAEGQVKLQKEAQDAQLLIGALQSVSAKQFKVLADAIQRANATRALPTPAPAAPKKAARAAPAAAAAAAAAASKNAAAAPSVPAPAPASAAPVPMGAASQNGNRKPQPHLAAKKH